jgi:chorismate dehydratase
MIVQKKFIFLCTQNKQLDKIKIGAVSYLNTKPLLYGIKRSKELMKMIELVEEYPSKIGNMLVENKIDIGLVPVAVIPQLKEWNIVTDYCIGADGDVASVCLFSEVPVEKIRRVLLDYQSKTSVSLAKILFNNHWKLSPEFINTKQDFRNEIKNETAGVIIGDRALQQRLASTYIYDLAGTWKTMTGLPFVFAAWIANKKLPLSFITLFNEANREGLHNIDAVIEENKNSFYDLKKYYTKNISFNLTLEKRQGMQLFLDFLK